MSSINSHYLKLIESNIGSNKSFYIPSEKSELNVAYAVCEIVVAVCAVIGNGLVIIVFSKEKKLRRRTNYYIISLASADLLVGLFAIPFAILASIGLPPNFYACLFTVSVLVVLCTISIFCLVAVSIDRYWAILYPMGYSRNVRTKTAIGIICVCWITGTLVGFLPLLGWNAGIKKTDDKCIFVEVMDYNYLVFLYFATIIFPAFLIAAFYAHIYRVVVQQLQQMMTMDPINSENDKGKKKKKQNGGSSSTGPMLRLLGAAQKREVKATQNLSRIVIFFIICWFPLYTINCVQAFCPNCHVNDYILNFSIILSHLNSVGNPLLYAYHLKDFRTALKNYIYRILFPKKILIKDNNTPINMKDYRASIISQRNLGRRSLATDVAITQPSMTVVKIVLSNKNIGDSTSNSISNKLADTTSLQYQSNVKNFEKIDEKKIENGKFGNSDNLDNCDLIENIPLNEYSSQINFKINHDNLNNSPVIHLREDQIKIEKINE